MVWITWFLFLLIIFSFLVLWFYDFLLIFHIYLNVLILLFFKLLLIVLVWWSNFNLQVEPIFLALVWLEYLMLWSRIFILKQILIWFVNSFDVDEVSVGCVHILELFLLWRWKVIAHLNGRWSGWRLFCTKCVLFWVAADLSCCFYFILFFLHFNVYFIILQTIIFFP